MSLLRFVGSMLMGAVPVLLLIARVAFGPTTRARLLIAGRFFAMGAGAVLISFRESGTSFWVAGIAVMILSQWSPRSTTEPASSAA